MPATRLSLLSVAALLLSGCSGNSDAGSQSVDGGSDADPNVEVGALQGIVVDDERRPIPEAEIMAQPGDRRATSNDNGRFIFAKLPVGEYTLEATRGGYYNASLKAVVEPRRTTSVLVTLLPLPADVAFYVTFPFSGLQRCMVYTNVFLASCSYPYTAAYGAARQHGVNLSTYGLPPDVMENRYRYNFTVGADHTGIVSELVWRAATDAARYYVLQLSCAWYDAVLDDCVAPGQTTWQPSNTYARARGVSPLRIEWQHEKPEWLPWVMSRAYLSGPADRPAGVALDQRIDMFNTVFYGAPVPKDWSILAASQPGG